MSSVQTLSDETFGSEVLGSSGPVLVDFWAAWCGPCRAIAPILDALASELHGEVRIAKLDVDANPESAQALGITSIPTLVLFRDGREVERIVGVPDVSTLRAKLHGLSAPVAVASASGTEVQP